MKFRDFKTEAPKPKDAEVKKPAKFDPENTGIGKAVKDVKDKTVSNFKAGYDAVKQQQAQPQSDGSVLGALGAIAGTGKQAVDLAKTAITPPTDIVDVDADKDAKAEPKAEPKAKAEKPESNKPKKFTDKKINSPQDLVGNKASYVDDKTNLLMTWDEKTSKWHPIQTPNQKGSPLDRDAGIKGFNKSSGGC